jgi:hypothetical protein
MKNGHSRTATTPRCRPADLDTGGLIAQVADAIVVYLHALILVPHKGHDVWRKVID